MDSTEREIIRERMERFRNENRRGGMADLMEESGVTRPTIYNFAKWPERAQAETCEALKIALDKLAPVLPYSQEEMDDNAVLAALAKDLRDIAYVVGNVKLPKDFRLGRFQDFIATYAKRMATVTKAVKGS